MTDPAEVYRMRILRKASYRCRCGAPARDVVGDKAVCRQHKQ